MDEKLFINIPLELNTIYSINNDLCFDKILQMVIQRLITNEIYCLLPIYIQIITNVY